MREGKGVQKRGEDRDQMGERVLPMSCASERVSGSSGDETAGRTKGREGGGIFGGRVEIRF